MFFKEKEKAAAEFKRILGSEKVAYNDLIEHSPYEKAAYKKMKRINYAETPELNTRYKVENVEWGMVGKDEDEIIEEKEFKEYAKGGKVGERIFVIQYARDGVVWIEQYQHPINIDKHIAEKIKIHKDSPVPSADYDYIFGFTLKNEKEYDKYLEDIQKGMRLHSEAGGGGKKGRKIFVIQFARDGVVWMEQYQHPINIDKYITEKIKIHKESPVPSADYDYIFGFTLKNEKEYDKYLEDIQKGMRLHSEYID